MGIIDKIKNMLPGNEVEKLVDQLVEWEQKHFNVNNGASYYNKAAKYNEYISESESVFPLYNIEKPELNPEPKSFFSVLWELFFPIPKIMLPSVIESYRNTISTEINEYRSNLKKAHALKVDAKHDEILISIDAAFQSVLKQLQNELTFCRFEQLKDTDYYMSVTKKFDEICQNLKEINCNFSKYLYTLSNMGIKDASRSIEQIKQRMDTFISVIQEYLND